MVLASQLFAAGHLSGRRIAVPLLRGTLRCVYTHVTLGDCLALLPCHPAQFGARSAHPPSRRCRVAQRRQYCPFVQTCERGEMAHRRGNANALSAIVSERKVAECSQSTHQECRWECSHAGDTNRCSKEDLSVRLVWRLSRGVNLLSWYETRVPISVGNGHRPTPTVQDMLS